MIEGPFDILADLQRLNCNSIEEIRWVWADSNPIYSLTKFSGGSYAKKIALFAVILTLNAFSPIGEASAKPYYCTQAYLACVGDCAAIGGVFGAACAVGCWIGYENCGS